MQQDQNRERFLVVSEAGRQVDLIDQRIGQQVGFNLLAEERAARFGAGESGDNGTIRGDQARCGGRPGRLEGGLRCGCAGHSWNGGRSDHLGGAAGAP